MAIPASKLSYAPQDPNPRVHDQAATDIYRGLFGEKYPPMVAKKMISLPSSLPPTLFKVDLTMVFATLIPKYNFAK